MKQFWTFNPPAFDRIDWKLPHTLSNIVCTCEECNKRRSDRSLEEVQLEVQLLTYAKQHNFPTTITEEKVINLVREGVTGGLSFVAHRYNFACQTPINRIYFYEVLNKAVSKDTTNIMTHVCGVDFNSLYPSAYSSIKSNKIPYAGGRLLMLGDFKEYILDKQKMKNIIKMRQELFIVKVKGSIPKISTVNL
jgi:hypothetical protein